MGRPLPPRRIRSGAYIPTQPRTGNENDAAIFRKRNLVTVGRGNFLYEQCWGGLIDSEEEGDTQLLTGSLTLTADSPTIIGVGTAFLTECHLGQFITAINSDVSVSWSLVVRRIISDTEMLVWKAPDMSAVDVSGWREPVIFPIEDRQGTALRGKVLKLQQGSYVGVGAGEFRLDGQPLPGESLQLTKRIRIAMPDFTSGNYSVFTLGMDTPPAPTLTAVAGGLKNMQAGPYSVLITPSRPETDGWNNPSLRADVLIAEDDKIRVTFPPMDIAHGQTGWKVWGTTYLDTKGIDLNYLQGPWHFVADVTMDDVSPSGGDVDFEWYDAEIEGNEIVSFNNDAPVDAEFVELINNVLLLVSCQGQGNVATPVATSPGPFVVPSKPRNVEAFPLELAASTTPPETIIGSLTSADGKGYLLTPNHLQIVIATPRDDIPVIVRPFWRDGFANPYQVAFLNGTLYGYTTGGPAQSIGEGDEIEAQKDWAGDVYEIMKDWNLGHVLVAYDPFFNAMCYFHSADHRNGAGFWTTRVLLYGISTRDWIGDLLLSSDTQDRLVSGVATIGDTLQTVQGGRRSIGILDQFITFPAIADKPANAEPFLISATASSGLICSFAVTSGPCSLVDHGDGTATVTLDGDLGTCVITASQAGNEFYNPATPVSRSFEVTDSGFDLDDISYALVCGGQDFTIGAFSAGEQIIENSDPPAGLSQGAYAVAPAVVTTVATVKFRFPATTGGSTLEAAAAVSLRYTTVSDCAFIGDSLIDFGWEIRVSPSGPTVIVSAKENSGAVLQQTTHAWDEDSVYEIKLEAAVPKLYKDGVLLMTGADNADGSTVTLFIRVDSIGGTDAGIVALQNYGAYV